MFAKGQKVESDINLWHNRIGHVNYQRFQYLQSKKIVFGLPKFNDQKAQICEPCQLGKQNRLPFTNECNRSRNKLNLIHSDVWGPTHNVNLGGSRYFVPFIDDYTRHTWIYLIEKKIKLFECLQSDGRKEYFSGQFNGYLQQMGIWRKFSCRYTPEQNTIA